MSRPKVLIVEDDTAALMRMEMKLHRHCELLTATTQDRATELFDDYQGQIDLIVMDACVPGHTINTLDFVKKIRVSYQGPIIASSSDEKLNELLTDAGCDSGCNKSDIVKMVLETLDFA